MHMYLWLIVHQWAPLPQALPSLHKLLDCCNVVTVQLGVIACLLRYAIDVVNGQTLTPAPERRQVVPVLCVLGHFPVYDQHHLSQSAARGMRLEGIKT